MTTGRINQVASINDLVARACFAAPKDKGAQQITTTIVILSNYSIGATNIMDVAISITCTASESTINSCVSQEPFKHMATENNTNQFAFPPTTPMWEHRGGNKSYITSQVPLCG